MVVVLLYNKKLGISFHLVFLFLILSDFHLYVSSNTILEILNKIRIELCLSRLKKVLL